MRYKDLDLTISKDLDVEISMVKVILFGEMIPRCYLKIATYCLESFIMRSRKPSRYLKIGLLFKIMLNVLNKIP